MVFEQVSIRLKARPRGFHLVTSEIVAALPQLAKCRVGVAHMFIQHTSASLTINENADPDVRADMERWFDKAVPEDAPYFVHTAEGSDDMPAHLKSAVTKTSETIPIAGASLVLGTWQGLYVWEHRAGRIFHDARNRRLGVRRRGEQHQTGESPKQTLQRAHSTSPCVLTSARNV